jgi:hypothetical protein
LEVDNVAHLCPFYLEQGLDELGVEDTQVAAALDALDELDALGCPGDYWKLHEGLEKDY